jgi:hypothetical protein
MTADEKEGLRHYEKVSGSDQIGRGYTVSTQLRLQENARRLDALKNKALQILMCWNELRMTGIQFSTNFKCLGKRWGI